uniref:hypothetical protein n=1 Tax=Phascolarctobacterium faecium TaxID=33025 RepID=UPI003AAF81A9
YLYIIYFTIFINVLNAQTKPRTKCAGFLILHHAAAIYGTPGVTAQAAVLALLYSAMLFLFSAVMLVL